MATSNQRVLVPIVFVGCATLAIAAVTQLMRSPSCEDRLSFEFEEPLLDAGRYTLALTADDASYECWVTVNALEHSVPAGKRDACRPEPGLALHWRGSALVGVSLVRAPSTARLVVRQGERVLYDAAIRPRYENFDGCSQSRQVLSRLR